MRCPPTNNLEPAVRAVADCIRVLRTRDGVPVTDAQAVERARNIVTALQGLGVISL